MVPANAYHTFPIIFTAGEEEEGAGTAAGVWREAGVLDDDTTDDDSVDGASTEPKGARRCVCGSTCRRFFSYFVKLWYIFDTRFLYVNPVDPGVVVLYRLFVTSGRVLILGGLLRYVQKEAYRTAT